MLVGRVFVGMGSETGITASYYIMSNYLPKDKLRQYNALIFIICTIASAGNLYIAPKLWIITKKLDYPLAVSEIANLVSVVTFLIFWCNNPYVREPVNVDIQEVLESEIKPLKRSDSQDELITETEGKKDKPWAFNSGEGLSDLERTNRRGSNAPTTQRTTDILKSKDCMPKICKFFGSFSGKYTALMVFNMTTSSAYLAAISFQTTFLNTYYE